MWTVDSTCRIFILDMSRSCHRARTVRQLVRKSPIDVVNHSWGTPIRLARSRLRCRRAPSPWSRTRALRSAVESGAIARLAAQLWAQNPSWPGALVVRARLALVQRPARRDVTGRRTQPRAAAAMDLRGGGLPHSRPFDASNRGHRRVGAPARTASRSGGAAKSPDRRGERSVRACRATGPSVAPWLHRCGQGAADGQG